MSENELYFANFLADSHKDKLFNLLESDFEIYKIIVNCFIFQSIAIAGAFGKNYDIASIVAYSHKLVTLCIKVKQGCEPHFMQETFSFTNIHDIVNYNNILSWYKLYDYHVLLQEQLSSPVVLNAKTILLELYSNWKIIGKNAC